MSKRRFTPQQVKLLLQNPHVAKCSEKSITYTKEFKLVAVSKYHTGMSSSEIFKEAGFDLSLIGRKVPKWCLQGWLKISREKGEEALKKDGRGSSSLGGRPKSIKHLSDKEKLKYLETEIAYLKAENDFLVKLRKKR